MLGRGNQRREEWEVPAVSSSRDIVRLVLTATGVCALGVAVALFFEESRIDAQWFYFTGLTVLLFGYLLFAGLREVKRRSLPLRRRWPLITAIVSLFILHVTVLGGIMWWLGEPDWHMAEWTLIGFADAAVCILVLELTYRYSVAPTTSVNR